jgi:hypothetical protein
VFGGAVQCWFTVHVPSLLAGSAWCSVGCQPCACCTSIWQDLCYLGLPPPCNPSQPLSCRCVGCHARLGSPAPSVLIDVGFSWSRMAPYTRASPCPGIDSTFARAHLAWVAASVWARWRQSRCNHPHTAQHPPVLPPKSRIHALHHHTHSQRRKACTCLTARPCGAVHTHCHPY